MIWNDIETRLGGWVRGQLILMGAVAVATSVAYGLLGLESWILLGVVAGLAEAIPIIGPLLGAVPALIVAATVSPELVVAVAAVYLVIQVVEGNVLVPYVMRNSIGISPFLIIVSLLIGAGIGGIPGAFLAVPVAAAIEVVLERLQARVVPVAQEPAGSDERGPGPEDATSQEARERRDIRAVRRERLRERAAAERGNEA
jgi:predicted PurR-regulated permease PerM